jgi:hypothetical protein
VQEPEDDHEGVRCEHRSSSSATARTIVQPSAPAVEGERDAVSRVAVTRTAYIRRPKCRLESWELLRYSVVGGRLQL